MHVYALAHNSVRMKADHSVEKRYTHNSALRVDAQREADIYGVENEDLTIMGTVTGIIHTYNSASVNMRLSDS